MAENSAISWTDHTFNPWFGCTKVSPGCDHCYAETLMATRYGRVQWGAGRARVRSSEETWKGPVRWNKAYQRELERAQNAILAFAPARPRVFCASLADVFDNEAPAQWRGELWALIRSTPGLDWMLLTKRIGNVQGMLPADWGNGWLHVWLGATVVNQEEADRDIPKLLAVPASVRFLSIEPMLGPVDLSRWLLAVRQTGQHVDGLGALDDEAGQHRLEQGGRIPHATDLPDSDRLPSKSLDAVVAPPDVATDGGLQPSHDGGIRVVDRDAGAVGAPILSPPVQVPLAVKQAGNVGDNRLVGRDRDALVAQRGPGSSRDALASNLALHAGAAGAQATADGFDGLTGNVGRGHIGRPVRASLHWVIVGGESGPHARPMHPDWARALRDQCAAAGVPFHFKQWGEWAPNCLCATKTAHRETPRPPGKPGCMFRCGTKAAGRLLDGLEHNGFPDA